MKLRTQQLDMICKKRAPVLLFTALIVCFFISLKAHATTVTPSDLSTQSCNATYYESLKSRAWLEEQRRSVQAQNYIRKPDSILDYSCFGIFNNIAAQETEQIFSESHAGHCYPDSLDCALDIVVMSTLQTYYTSNYDHTFLGGASFLSRESYDPHSTTMCSVMADVWNIAKCINFALDTTQDGFMNFAEYASLEPRRLPIPCTTNDPDLWNNAIENAFTPASPTAWYAEVVGSSETNDENYEQYLDSGSGGLGCGDLIRTGITIIDGGSIFYRSGVVDGVCANPACSQDADGNCSLITF